MPTWNQRISTRLTSSSAPPVISRVRPSLEKARPRHRYWNTFTIRAGWKSAGRKLSLTQAGRTAWEQHAPPERREAVRQAEEDLRKLRQIELLTQVDKKAGKAFKSKEMSKFDATFVQAACEQRLIERKGENQFALLPSGKAILRAEEPLDVQIEKIQKAFKETHDLCEAARQRFVSDLAESPPGFATEVLANLRRHMDSAAATFVTAAAELRQSAALAACCRTASEPDPRRANRGSKPPRKIRGNGTTNPRRSLNRSFSNHGIPRRIR